MKGTVVSDVDYKASNSEFDFKPENSEIQNVRIKSSGKQAVLDYIFIRQGQTVFAEGQITNDEISDANTIISIKEII